VPQPLFFSIDPDPRKGYGMRGWEDLLEETRIPSRLEADEIIDRTGEDPEGMPRRRALTQPQLEEIKSLLEERKRLIEEEIRKGFSRALEDSEEETTVVDVSEGDESHVDVGKEMSFQVISRRSSELKQIKEALLRIASGDYGVCEECGNPIRFERLKAMPFAQLCKGCQEDSEIKERERK